MYNRVCVQLKVQPFLFRNSFLFAFQGFFFLFPFPLSGLGQTFITFFVFFRLREEKKEILTVHRRRTFIKRARKVPVCPRKRNVQLALNMAKKV